MKERDGEKRNKEREWDEEEMLHRKQGLRWRGGTLICISFLGSSSLLGRASMLMCFCFFFVFQAPHEICKEEHLLAMSWKRASAGETVYNKCPTNATGQSHIRHHTSG